MAVVLETTLGDITIDLYINERPRACLNFLKLCKLKYYNYNLFHTVNQGFIAQTGDPTGMRDGGESIWGVLEGPEKRYFEGEDTPRIKHTTTGLVSFVGDSNNMVGSQFFITLAPDLTYLDAQHCVFGEVTEGLETLRLLNEAICDNEHRPYQDIRITHTVILEDPFPDPAKLIVPDASPEPTADRLQGGRIAPDEEIDETAGKSVQEIAEIAAEREAKARATILEMIGDIPDAEMAPPENVLFVCKLNPVTTDDDLEIIFSRFGKIKSCEVIRDKKTDDSLQYAFVEFMEQKSCEDAYFKMDNVLIDDRRIHVDFSQSVAKIKWHGKGRGVTHYNDRGESQRDDPRNDIGNGRYRAVKKENDREESRERDKVNGRRREDNNRRDDRQQSPSRERYGNSRNREPYFGNRQAQYRDERNYRNDRYRQHSYNDRYRHNYSRDNRRGRYDDRMPNRSRENEASRSRNNDRSISQEEKENNRRQRKKRNERYEDDSERQKSDKNQKKRQASTEDDEDSSDGERIKKSKKSKKKKSRKKMQSNSDSDVESNSDSDEKKSKKKKRKSKKRQSSSDSDSESEKARMKKSKKHR
ncbi:uncharacterized protein CBL_09081 [Carabus blaptoides fortunei]